MEKLWFYIIVLIAIGAVSQQLTEKKKKSKEYQYLKKESVITEPEKELFNTLIEILGDRFYLFPQVHLSAILNNKVKGQNWKSAFNHINGKSVDFLICDKNNLSPILAIELDDSSHNRDDRIARDKEVERIFKDIELPLLRLRINDSINTQYIRTQIENILNNFSPSK